MARHRKKIIDLASAIVVLTLVMLDITLWMDIFIARRQGSAGGNTSAPRVYALPVPHASSTLLVLPGGAMVLTNAGSDATIVGDLQKLLLAGAPSYIDLAIIAAPQIADYGGYQYLLAHYNVGAFIYNGRADAAYKTEWTQLVNAIAAKHIPLITLGAGDCVHFGGAGGVAHSEIDILSPDAASARSPNASDTAITQRVITPGAGVVLYNK